MKIAATIGTFAMANFVELNIVSLRRVFGQDLPILLSDDKSDESPVIESLAAKYDCSYCVSDSRRFHFAGDFQAIVSSIQFAKQCGADIACKVSQRFIIVAPVIKECVERYFADPNIAIAIPGTPPSIQVYTSKMWSRFPFLTDCVFCRTEAVSPELLRDFYETSWKSSGSPNACIPEMVFGGLINGGPMQGRAVRFLELTEHNPDRPKWFHRRCQSYTQEYRKHANSLGLDSHYALSEWKTMDRAYAPRPQA